MFYLKKPNLHGHCSDTSPHIQMILNENLHSFIHSLSMKPNQNIHAFICSAICPSIHSSPAVWNIQGKPIAWKLHAAKELFIMAPIIMLLNFITLIVENWHHDFWLFWGGKQNCNSGIMVGEKLGNLRWRCYVIYTYGLGVIEYWNILLTSLYFGKVFDL